MSFYVLATPKVSDRLGYIHSGNTYAYVITNKGRDFYPKTKQQWENFDHTGLHEFYLHDEYGFIPVGSLEKTKQQNEKLDQKEENENMNRKENFPVVGAAVLIKSKHGIKVLEDSIANACMDKECIVLSKFKYFDREVVSVCLDEFSGVACFTVDYCHPIKTEQEKEIENLLDLICKGGTVNDIAERLYDEGYRKQKD